MEDKMYIPILQLPGEARRRGLPEGVLELHAVLPVGAHVRRPQGPVQALAAQHRLQAVAAHLQGTREWRGAGRK